MFEREDWTAFRSLETLTRKAGVPARRLGHLVLKELADNALDAAGSCRIVAADPNGLSDRFTVEDDGDGIPGDDAHMAALFSINRPLTSSKALRLPCRGALGNGLRVVAGAVLVAGGELIVTTRGRRLRLTPKNDGTTDHEVLGPSDRRGTLVEICLPPPLYVTNQAIAWADEAIFLAGGGPRYTGKTSPHWYDSDAFFELLQSAGTRTVRELIAEFDGCTEPKAGKIAAQFKGRLARTLDRHAADQLLHAARAHARPVVPKRLGGIGRMVGLPASYARGESFLKLESATGSITADIPLVIEAWAEPVSAQSDVHFSVNRTPIVGDITVNHFKSRLSLRGCGLNHLFSESVRRPIALRINIETPYMPITSDGKTPDLGRMVNVIYQVAGKAIRLAKRSAPVDATICQKDIILANLDAAIAKASGNGEYRFSLRQLYYAVRPYVLEAAEKEPDYNYFAQVITDYEATQGADIPGVYRDARGTLYHPHTHETIPLGTLNAEGYERPEWTFNKILYCEKEGFFPILRDAGWPERHDCALMTSKGFASRAARDVLDLLGETGEDLYFYCIHDADAYGTMIYQGLQEATRARAGRKVHIVNLGLEPAEAIAMNLQVEDVRRKGDKSAPVAEYIDADTAEWLQSHRVELNAMTTPQFLEWLQAKFSGQPGKVVPPDDVLIDRFKDDVRGMLRHAITERVLHAARVDDQVAAAFADRADVIEAQSGELAREVKASLGRKPEQQWVTPVNRTAAAVVGVIK